MIFGLAAHDLLAWFLTAFFIVGAIGNWVAPKNVRADYVRWGYPPWFHRVTAMLELPTGILLAMASTRPWGIVLGLAVMAAALMTLIKHREYKHAIAPSVVLALLLLLLLWGRAALL
ncbi:MAG: DoxX family protein [Spirochaetia bacterium]|nr:MAG: DoxX family protein [Spirochaetia bacterium]